MPPLSKPRVRRASVDDAEALAVLGQALNDGAGRALMAAVAADARRRALEFVWWASRTWNADAHAFFRTFTTVEEPVIAFATFGDGFTKLADEGDQEVPPV